MQKPNKTLLVSLLVVFAVVTMAIFAYGGYLIGQDSVKNVVCKKPYTWQDVVMAVGIFWAIAFILKGAKIQINTSIKAKRGKKDAKLE